MRAVLYHCNEKFIYYHVALRTLKKTEKTEFPIDESHFFRYNIIEYKCVIGGVDVERQISASMLSADLLHLEDEVRRVEQSGADMLHFDVMDGVYVPNISFGLPILKAVRSAASLFLDVHLMIQNPGLYIRNFAESGADMITFHIETGGFPFRTIQAIRKEGKKAGIALNPGTPAQAVLPYLDAVDNILVMTVEPGFGGQSYMHDMNDKIRQVREMIGARPVHLQVDGGINQETAREAAAAGADLLVAGSYLFSASDMKAAVQSLRVPEGAVS